MSFEFKTNDYMESKLIVNELMNCMSCTDSREGTFESTSSQ